MTTIERMMLDRGWTIIQLSGKTNRTVQALKDIFSGKVKNPHRKTKAALAQAFGVKIEQLFAVGGEDEL